MQKGAGTAPAAAAPGGSAGAATPAPLVLQPSHAAAAPPRGALGGVGARSAVRRVETLPSRQQLLAGNALIQAMRSDAAQQVRAAGVLGNGSGALVVRARQAQQGGCRAASTCRAKRSFPRTHHRLCSRLSSRTQIMTAQAPQDSPTAAPSTRASQPLLPATTATSGGIAAAISAVLGRGAPAPAAPSPRGAGPLATQGSHALGGAAAHREGSYTSTLGGRPSATPTAAAAMTRASTLTRQAGAYAEFVIQGACQGRLG